MYQPYPKTKFDTLKRDWWFQEIAQHISSQAESPRFVTNLELVDQLPAQARAIYFLWIFSGEVGGNGLECYLLQQQGHYAPYAHEALKTIGAFELVERLEAAIPHAIATGCVEFSAGNNMSWFRQFPINPKYPSLQATDVGIYELANDGIKHKCNDFIAAHRGVFIA